MQHQGGLMQHRCGERERDRKKKAKNKAKQTHQPHGPDYRITGYGLSSIVRASRATTGCLFEQKGLEMHTITSTATTSQHHVVLCPGVTYRTVKWNLDLCRLIMSLIQLVCWWIYQLQRSILVYSECNNVNVWHTLR